jgi:hypothetical protein
MTLINSTINPKSQRKIFGISAAVIILLLPLFLLLLNHDNHLETAQSFCPFKMLTGFPCPGCGITKSMVYCYEGDIVKSLYYHILGPFIILFCIVTITVLTTELVTRKEYFNKFLFNKKIAYGLAIFLGVYHLIRIIYFVTTNSFDEILRQSIWK